MKFDCPRTCPLFKDIWCRFRPILDGIGPVKVNSHTAKIKVEFTDPESLERAVKVMGGTWLGLGARHLLFAGSETGWGFTLPGWRYPLILNDGKLLYDDYNGLWGNVKDLDKLKAEYALAKAVTQAELLGWQCERTATGETIIYHPSGGTLTISEMSYEASGFHGEGCHDARKQLGLDVEDIQTKSEACEVPLKIQQPGS